MSVVRGDTTRRWVTVIVAIGLVGVTPLVIGARPVAATGLSAEQVVADAELSATVPHDGLVQIDATHWQINSADGTIHDLITLTNGATVDPSDYIFGP